MQDDNPQKSGRNPIGWAAKHAADGAGRGISDLVRYAIIGVVLIIIVGALGLTISKINIGGIEVPLNPQPTRNSEPSNNTSSQPVINTVQCPNISDGYNKTFLMQVGGYYTDYEAYYGDTGHYMSYVNNSSVEIGAEYQGHGITYVDPYNLTPGRWVNVHPYSNSYGALALCKDSSGTLYGAIVNYSFY